ncbi:MAG: MoxR-like ATPase [Candidatus Woesearchaeota archaeon]|jgi:MoxR-like ATPase
MAFEKHFQKTFETTQGFEQIIGQDSAKRQIKTALLTGRHMLILGSPGIGKTTLVRDVAKLLPVEEGKKAPFVRVQGSPDLTSEDLIGDIDPIKALEFGPLSKEAFVPGKIFKANGGVLFFDEVNRCSEKLQNALLQVLEEGVVTIGSYDVDMTSKFIFIGTLNPQDSSTEKLSDAFMDRFDVIRMTYPETEKIEATIVTQHANTNDITVPAAVLSNVVGYVQQLRDSDKLSKLPSVRASIGIIERACAHALLNKRTTVELLDVTAILVSVLAHRIELKPSYKYLQNTQDFIKSQFNDFSKKAGISAGEELFDEDTADST